MKRFAMSLGLGAALLALAGPADAQWRYTDDKGVTRVTQYKIDIPTAHRDAAEWIGPYDDLKLGFHKVAPNYYYPGWWEGGLNCEFYINDKALAELPKEYRDVIEHASKVAHVNMQAKYDARNPVALRQLAQNGVKLHGLNTTIMEAAFKESMAIYAELSAKNPNWKKVYEDYANFRRDQNLWFRFAEAGFDDFMQSQKL